jgi:hypothetical protein
MTANQRWPARYAAFYVAYYQELLTGSVIERWQKIDLGISLLVALTASGSAISGLAWWSTASGKPIWALLAATASLGAIFHSTARVPNHLKEQGEARRVFSFLRGKLQFILFKMTSDGDGDELESEYEELQGKLVELMSKLDPDLAATLRLRNKTQDELKRLLHQLGVTKQGIIGSAEGESGHK